MSPRWFGSNPSDGANSSDSENQETESGSKVSSNVAFPRAERLEPSIFNLKEFPKSPTLENLSAASLLGMGYHLEDRFSDLEISEDDWVALRRYLTFVPLTSGFFSSFKWLVKRLEEIYFTKQLEKDSQRIISALAVAFARVEARRQFALASNSQLPDPVKFQIDVGSFKLMNEDRRATFKYLQRRGMHLHDFLMKNDSQNEAIFRLTFIMHVDNLHVIEGKQDTLKRQWILAKLLYSETGQFSRAPSSRSISIPNASVRQNSGVVIDIADFNSSIAQDFFKHTKCTNPDVLNAVWNTLKSQGMSFTWTADSFYSALQVNNSDIRAEAILAMKVNPQLLRKLTVFSIKEISKETDSTLIESFSKSLELISQAEFNNLVDNWLLRIDFNEFQGLAALFALEIMASPKFEKSIRNIRSNYFKVGTYLLQWKFAKILQLISANSNYQPIETWKRLLSSPTSRQFFPWVKENWERNQEPATGNLWGAPPAHPPREITDLLVPYIENIGSLTLHWQKGWLEKGSEDSAYFVLKVLVRSGNRETFASALDAISKSQNAENLILLTLNVLRSSQKLDWFSDCLESLSDPKFDKTWREYGSEIKTEILDDPISRRHLWENFETFSRPTISRLIGFPDFGKQVLSVLKRNDFLTLTEKQGDFLFTILERDASAVQELNLWPALIACPVQSINRWACRTVGNLGFTGKYWLDLAESGLPYPMEQAKQYLLSKEIEGSSELLEKLLVLLDSDLDIVRKMGLEILKSSELRVDRNSLVNALAEHTENDVWQYVTENIDALTNGEANKQFNNEVFLARRKSRRTKNILIKKHLENVEDFPDEELLLRLSLGSNLRDREFALKMLALRESSSEAKVETTWQGDSNV